MTGGTKVTRIAVPLLAVVIESVGRGIISLRLRDTKLNSRKDVKILGEMFFV